MCNCIRLILATLLLALPTSVFSAVDIIEVTTKDSASTAKASHFTDAVTRENSCSLYIDGFTFSQTKPKPYYVELSINLNTFLAGGAAPDRTKSLKLLLKDVITVNSSNKPIMLSINNIKLADNIILNEITDIDINVNLVPVKDSSTDKFKLISPLLNNMFTAANPAFQVINNFIQAEKSSDGKDILVFHTNLVVPQNSFEFGKLKKENKLPMIENNQVMGIILSGLTDVPLSSSLLGDAAAFLNGIAKFVVGQSLIDKDKVTYDGILKLYFTKDVNPLMPKSLLDDLNDIEILTNSVDVADAYNSYVTKMKQISSTSLSAKNEGKINNQTYYNITSFLRLGEIFLDYKKSAYVSSPVGSPNSWINKFIIFENSIDISGVNNSIQALGITDIYDDKIAKIYIPYSLTDSLSLSFYDWQLQLHSQMATAKNYSVSKPVPKSKP